MLPGFCIRRIRNRPDSANEGDADGVLGADVLETDADVVLLVSFAVSKLPSELACVDGCVGKIPSLESRGSSKNGLAVVFVLLDEDPPLCNGAGSCRGLKGKLLLNGVVMLAGLGCCCCRGWC